MQRRSQESSHARPVPLRSSVPGNNGNSGSVSGMMTGDAVLRRSVGRHCGIENLFRRRQTLENPLGAGREKDSSIRHAACIPGSAVAPARVGPGKGLSDVWRFRHDEETRLDCVWPDSAGTDGWALGGVRAGPRASRASPTKQSLRPPAASTDTAASRLCHWFSPGSRVLRPSCCRCPHPTRQSPLFDWDWVSPGGACTTVLRTGRLRLDGRRLLPTECRLVTRRSQPVRTSRGVRLLEVQGP